MLQIVRDVKFIKSTQIVAQNTYIDSESVTVSPARKDVHNYIENQIIVINSKRDLIKKIKSENYNVVFFHSLPIKYYSIIKEIPHGTIVMWFSYGFDIYGDKYEHGLFGLPAFVEIDLYKPKTRQAIKMASTSIYRVKQWILKMNYYPQWSRRNNVLKRIDYFQPVKPLDFKMMQNVNGFRAKEIFLSNYGRSIEGKEFIPHKAEGAIILGNSASPICNHLDVWDFIKRKIEVGRPIIVPLSYGNLQYAKIVKNELRGESDSIHFLEVFLPRDEYFKVMDSCSYAIYGSMRQHAMGNIYNALRNDVKVFLYRDSPMYSYLKEMGFVVYAIEDIDSSSFIRPITETEHLQNVKAFNKEYDYCRSKGQESFKEILRPE